MAQQMSQEVIDALILKYDIRDCHIEVNELSKKKLHKKIKELIARCRITAAQNESLEQQQQPLQEQESQQVPQQSVPDAGAGDVDPDAEPEDNTGKHVQADVPSEEPELMQPQQDKDDEDDDHQPVPDLVYADTTDESPTNSDDVNDEDEVRDEGYFLRKYNVDPEWPQLLLDRLDPEYVAWITREREVVSSQQSSVSSESSGKRGKRQAVKVKKEKKPPKASRKATKKKNKGTKSRPAFHEGEESESAPDSDQEYTQDPVELEVEAGDPDDDEDYFLEEDDDTEQEEDDGPDDAGDEDFAPEEPKAKRQRKTAAAAGTSGTRTRTEKKTKAKAAAGERKYRTKFRIHHCDSCNFSTTMAKVIKDHTLKHQMGEEPMLTCVPCNMQFFTRTDHSVHQYEAHDGPQKLPRVIYLHCKSCDQTFEGVKEFNCHIINHIRAVDDGYQCSHSSCSFISVKFASATDHVKTHTLYKCTFCDRVMAKMEMLQQHCNQSHRNFGLPFRCDLCDYRSSVFGLTVQHKEETHGITFDRDADTCRFCGEDPRVVFESVEDKMVHLAIHADFSDRLFRCSHMDCDFTTGSAENFHDHNLLTHITDELSDEITWELDKDGLLDAISQAVKKQFKKVTATAASSASSSSATPETRKKPLPQETDCAVSSILEFLTPDDSDEQMMSSGTMGAGSDFVVTSGDMELDYAFESTANLSDMNGHAGLMDISELPLFDSS